MLYLVVGPKVREFVPPEGARVERRGRDWLETDQEIVAWSRGIAAEAMGEDIYILTSLELVLFTIQVMVARTAAGVKRVANSPRDKYEPIQEDEKLAWKNVCVLYAGEEAVDWLRLRSNGDIDYPERKHPLMDLWRSDFDLIDEFDTLQCERVEKSDVESDSD